MLTLWIKSVHKYTGLVNFTVLMVFGIIGIVATALPKPSERQKPSSTVQVRDFPIPGGMTDRQLQDHIQTSLKIPLTGPAPDWALRAGGADMRSWHVCDGEVSVIEQTVR